MSTPIDEPSVKPPGAVKRRSYVPLALCLFFLAVAVLAGGWFYVRIAGASPPADAGPFVDVSADTPPGLMRRGGRMVRPPGQPGPQRNPLRALVNRFATQVPDGIVPTGTGYMIKADISRVDITRQGNLGKWQYRFTFQNQATPTPEQQTVLQAPNKARDPVAGKAAGVTADQLNKLKNLPPIAISAADRGQIATLFTAWLKAAGLDTQANNQSAAPPRSIPASAKPAETALLQALSSVGKRAEAQTAQTIADRVAAIRAALGDSVLEKLK